MDTTILLTVAACLLVAYLINWLWSSSKQPPGPIGLPILGYIPFLSSKPYIDLERLAKKYGNVFSLRLGSEYMVILNDFESSKEAFAKDAFMGRPPESPFEQNKVTRELEAFNGLPWKEQRRFSLHMLKDMGLGKSKLEEDVQEEIRDLLQHLEKKAGQPFCIYDLLAPSMSNNIGSMMFGRRLEYDHPDRQMLTNYIKETASAAGQAAWQLFFPSVRKIFRFLGIGDVDRISRIGQGMKEYVEKEIDEHEKTLDPNNIRDYIDGYLLEIQKRKDDPAFCKPVLADMVGTFFGAGSETVRLSVEWLILVAATYQDVQRRVQQEIDDVIGREKEPEFTDHRAMPYTEAVTMELMRWRTIIPLNLIRYALKDGEIGGYHIPKGAQIMANLWAIHHNPEYWGQDADEFRPERFLSEDGRELKKREHFIPFSIGKRACPGEPLAKMETFLYFTSILQKFHVKLPEGKTADFEGDLGIGLMPKAQELIYTKRT